MKIFHIEDDPDKRDSLKELLEILGKDEWTDGYSGKGDQAWNTPSILATALDDADAIIILDIALPNPFGRGNELELLRNEIALRKITIERCLELEGIRNIKNHHRDNQLAAHVLAAALACNLRVIVSSTEGLNPSFASRNLKLRTCPVPKANDDSAGRAATLQALADEVRALIGQADMFREAQKTWAEGETEAAKFFTHGHHEFPGNPTLLSSAASALGSIVKAWDCEFPQMSPLDSVHTLKSRCKGDTYVSLPIIMAALGMGQGTFHAVGPGDCRYFEEQSASCCKRLPRYVELNRCPDSERGLGAATTDVDAGRFTLALIRLCTSEPRFGTVKKKTLTVPDTKIGNCVIEFETEFETEEYARSTSEQLWLSPGDYKARLGRAIDGRANLACYWLRRATWRGVPRAEYAWCRVAGRTQTLQFQFCCVV